MPFTIERMPILDETEIMLITKIHQRFGVNTPENRASLQYAYRYARNTAEAWSSETVAHEDIERTILYIQRKIVRNPGLNLSYVNSLQALDFVYFCEDFAFKKYSALIKRDTMTVEYNSAADAMLTRFLEVDLFQDNQILGWLLWALYHAYGGDAWPLHLPDFELLSNAS